MSGIQAAAIIAILALAVAGCGKVGTVSGRSAATSTRAAASTSTSASTSTNSPRSPTAVAVPSILAGNAHPALSRGKAGQLDVIYSGSAYNPGGEPSGGTFLPIAVWNGTSQPAEDLDISGTAMSGSAVVGSGDSQDVEPPNLQPGQVAFGIVFFKTAVPSGATFTFNVTQVGADSNTIPVQVTQANYVPGGPDGTNGVVGSVSNRTGPTVSGPISADVFCFTNGSLTAVDDGFTSGNGDLAPGARASYDTDVLGPCPTFLVGASGFTTG